jgi:MFS family permease
MVAVALPRIRDEFHIGVGPLTLLVSVYLVAVAVSQPVSGKLGDTVGHRRMILAGLAVLFASSLGAALAWNFWMLVILRAFQGIAAAMVMPNGVAYLRKSLDSNTLGRSLGYNGAAISAGAAMGPVFGGLVLSVAGWRAMFLVNVPAAAVIALFILTLAADHTGRAVRPRIDFPSLAALGAAFAGLVVLGNAARLHNPALVVAACLVLPVAALLYLGLYRRTGSGVVDLRLFARADYASSAMTTALSNLVMYTALIFIPIYLDELRHSSEAAIGLILFSLSVSTVIVSPFSGRLSDSKGHRLPAATGAAGVLIGAVALAACIGEFAPWAVAVPLAAVGVGMGLMGAAQQTSALRAWGTEVAGSASGTLSMMRYVGSVGGAALMAAIVGSRPTVTEVRLLAWVLAAFAVLNLAIAAFVGNRRRTVAESQPAGSRATA